MTKIMAVLFILGFLTTSSCNNTVTTTPVTQTTTSSTQISPPITSVATKLEEVPIKVGTMAFNESNNAGFNKSIIDSWSTDDLIITTDGNITGTFLTIYGDETLTGYQTRDVLIVRVRADYIFKDFGDHVYAGLTDFLPFIGQQSDKYSVTFNVEGTFDIPSSGTSETYLAGIEVGLTWVRVYNVNDTLNYQILPGDADSYDPNITTISFNTQMSDSIQGRFGHYTSLFKENRLRYKGIVKPVMSEFNYCTWIKENVIW